MRRTAVTPLARRHIPAKRAESPGLNTERRRAPRETPKLSATLKGDAVALYGALLDISASGAFFCCAYGVVDGQFVPMPEQAGCIAVGDRLTLVFDNECEQRRTVAIVRWIGWSDYHASDGIGLEL